MPHMKYGGQNFLLTSNVDFDELKESIDETLKGNTTLCLNINGKGGLRNAFFVSRGVPISLHSWDPVNTDGFIEGLNNMGIDHRTDRAPANDA